jgi:hypothetical protein
MRGRMASYSKWTQLVMKNVCSVDSLLCIRTLLTIGTVRKALPRFNPRSLTSARILAQRSAVPAVTSRTTPSATSGGKRKISNEEKERLLRIGKRARKGPFNSYQDEMEFGKGSAMLEVSAAVKQSGKYNVWDEVVEEVDLNVPEVLRKQAPKVFPVYVWSSRMSHDERSLQESFILRRR